MTRGRRVRELCALLFAASMMSGCAAVFSRESAPIDWYLLSSAPASTTAARTDAAAAGPIYAVAPVRVPEYLSQRSIVTRTGENELRLAADAQWASPLADGIASVLGENISLLIPSDRVVQLPVSSAVPVDYEIRVEIVRFERQPDASVDLVARWTVFGEGGRRMIAMERTSLRRDGVADDYRSIAAAMSGLLLDLSRAVAGTLRNAASTPLS